MMTSSDWMSRIGSAALRAASVVGRWVRRDDRGAIAVLWALLIPVVLGCVAMGVEVGLWYQEKRGLQSMADAAAYAAILELKAATGDEQTVGQAEANRNGYDAATDTLDINNPPVVNAEYAGDTTVVEAIVTRSIPPLLTSVLTGSTADITLTVSALAKINAGGPCCMLGLSDDDTSVTLSGSADISQPSCVICSRSTNNPAINCTGAASVDVAEIAAPGSVDIGGSCDTGDAAIETVPAPTDPYASLAAPSEITPDATATTCSVSGNTNVNTLAKCSSILFAGGACASQYTVSVNCTYAGGDIVIPTSTLKINGGSVTVANGSLTVRGGINVQSGSLSVPNGDVIANGNTSVSGSLTVSSGKFQTGGTLSVSGTMSVSNGTLYSGGGLDVSGSLNHAGGTLHVTGDFDVGTTGDLTHSNGTIYIKNGDLTVQGDLTTTETTVYFGGTSGGSITVNSQANVTLDPPDADSDGENHEMAIWQSTTTCGDIHFNGGATQSIYGVLYGPCSDLQWNGNNTSSSECVIIVTDHIDINGNPGLYSSGGCTGFDSPPPPSVPGSISWVG